MFGSISTSSTKLSSGASYSIGTGASNTFNTVTSTLPEIDYSINTYDVEVTNVANTVTSTEGVESNNSVNQVNGVGITPNKDGFYDKYNSEFKPAPPPQPEKSAWDKYWTESFGKNIKKNGIFYTISGLCGDPQFLTSFLGLMGVTATGNSYINTVAASGLAKSLAALAVGGDVEVAMFEGIFKKAQTESKPAKWLKDVVKKGYEKLSGVSDEFIPDEALDVVDDAVKAKDSIWSRIVSGKTTVDKFDDMARMGDADARWLNTAKSGGAYLEGVNVGGMGLTFGIDYLASLAVNVGKAKIAGKSWSEAFNLENAKYGSQALKSAWKGSCQVAFQTIGAALLGPKGKMIGAIVGNIVGAEIGNFCVDVLFEGDEKWCGIAAGATVVGATAGGVLVTALAVGGAFATVPIAGWAIGGAIIVGAAIGTAVVAVIARWDDITGAVSDAWDATTDFVAEKWDQATDYVAEKWDQVTDAAANAWKDVKHAVASWSW